MTVDACGVPVKAGPAEATVTGNALVPLIALGEIGDLSEARKVVRDSTPLKVYTPSSPEEWDAHYGAFLKAIGR